MVPAKVKLAVPPELLAQVDVRVGTIESVNDVANSDKLAALRVNFGDHVRTVLAGMKRERANPRELEGKQALFVVNLPPRKMAGMVGRPCCLTSATRMGFCLCWQCQKPMYPTEPGQDNADRLPTS